MSIPRAWTIVPGDSMIVDSQDHQTPLPLGLLFDIDQNRQEQSAGCCKYRDTSISYHMDINPSYISRIRPVCIMYLLSEQATATL